MSSGFSAGPGLPARVQQVLERLSLYGLVGHAPETEACHHRSVRAPQRRCVWVIGKVEAVAFGQLRWSVCFSHAALNVTRRLPDQTYSSECVEGVFSDVRSLRPPQLDPNLTLTRTQCPAIVGKPGNKKRLTYAEFANPCNTRQPLT